MARAPDDTNWTVLSSDDFCKVADDIRDRQEKAIAELKTPFIRLDDGSTLLHCLAQESYPDNVLLNLLHAGIPVDATNATNTTALVFAATFGKLRACKLLVGHGASMSISSNFPCMGTPLRASTYSGSSETFLWLLEQYGDGRLRWDQSLFERLMKYMPQAAVPYLDKFAIEREETYNMIFLDLGLIYGNPSVRIKDTTLSFAIDQASDGNNVLTHPVMRYITNVKWDLMGYVFYEELFAYLGLLLSYFTATIIGDPDWIRFHDNNDYCVMSLRVIAWFCCLYLIVKVEFRELLNDRISYFKSFWNWLNVVSYGAVLVSIPLECFGKSTSPTHHGLISLINASLWINLLQYMCIRRSTGILINTMGRMTRDVRQFLILYSVFLLGFSSALHSVMNDDDGYKTYGDTFITVLLMLFGNLTYDPYNNATGWKWVFSNLLLFIYLISVVVMLLNVLIAMMSSSFNLITEAAEAQYLLNRAETILRIERTIGKDVRENIFKKASDEVAVDGPNAPSSNESKSVAMVLPLLTSLEEGSTVEPKTDIDKALIVKKDAGSKSKSPAGLPPVRISNMKYRYDAIKPLEDGFHSVQQIVEETGKNKPKRIQSEEATTNEEIALQLRALSATVGKIESFQDSVNHDIAKRFEDMAHRFEILQVLLEKET